MSDPYAAIRDFFIEDRGWSKDAVSGTVTTEEAIDIAREFLVENGISCQSACVFGSTATKSRKPFSDIDILAIDKDCENFTKERKIYKGIPIELNTVNYDSLIRLMELGAKSGSPYFVYPMMNNVLIYGDKEVFDNLQLISRTIIESKPLQLTEQSTIAHREIVTSQVIDIIGSTNAYDSFMLSCACMNSIGSLFLQYSTGFIFTGRYSLTMMREHHPSIIRDFENIIGRCFLNNDFSEFVHFSLLLLDKFGGISWKKNLKIVQKL